MAEPGHPHVVGVLYNWPRLAGTPETSAKKRKTIPSCAIPQLRSGTCAAYLTTNLAE